MAPTQSRATFRVSAGCHLCGPLLDSLHLPWEAQENQVSCLQLPTVLTESARFSVLAHAILLVSTRPLVPNIINL